MSIDISYNDHVLTVRKTYDAPREAVFDAWVETNKVQQWWGCAQTTKVSSEIEQKVGGKYIHMMTIDGAGEFPGGGMLKEYDPPKLLAFVAEDPIHNQKNLVRVRFEEKGDQTEVTLTHDNLPMDLSGIVRGGWTAAFTKLGEFLKRAEAA